jgi:hypothetical protein
MSKPPFVNMFDIAGVLVIITVLSTFCWLIGLLPLKAVGLLVVLTVGALIATKKGAG